MKDTKAFSNFKHNGIHLTFPNGNAISTIWGAGSYSDNHDYNLNNESGDGVRGYHTFMQSDTCGIMILSCPDKLLKKIIEKYNEDYDSPVIEHITMSQWLEIIKLLSK